MKVIPSKVLSCTAPQVDSGRWPVSGGGNSGPTLAAVVVALAATMMITRVIQPVRKTLERV